MGASLRGWLRRWVSEPAWRGGALVLAFGALERLFLWWVYQPIPYPDTGSYQRLAGVLRALTLDGYDGTRVPGYPAFLALLGQDAQKIWLAQMVLGLAISLLLFWMTWRTTAHAWLSAAVALAYDLIPGQLLFEADLLTETLTTFFVVLSLASMVGLRGANRDRRQLSLTLAAGVASSLAGLVRPLFYILPVWLLPFVWAASGTIGQRIWRSALFCLGPVVLLGGWLAYIDNTYGMLSPTTMGGYSLVQHTGNWFEYLPDEYAPIRDTYLRYRDARIAERGNQTNTIWEAIPELSQVSGLGFYDLSRELQRLSILLIREHPGLYLRSAVEGWIAFWKAPVYWQPEAMEPAAARSAFAGLSLLGRAISIAANGLFLLLAAASVVSRRARVRLGVGGHAWMVGGTVLVTSVVQTLVDHGDNPRFLVPLQMAVIYVVMRQMGHWAGWWKEAPG
ncbi:MAG: hypothetical protein AB1449_01095 [Chloroflexota bacterium]